jgi:hypothetical protein
MDTVDIPEWILEAAKEIDLRYGDLSIQEEVARIIFEKWKEEA